MFQIFVESLLSIRKKDLAYCCFWIVRKWYNSGRMFRLSCSRAVSAMKQKLYTHCDDATKESDIDVEDGSSSSPTILEQVNIIPVKHMIFLPQRYY